MRTRPSSRLALLVLVAAAALAAVRAVAAPALTSGEKAAAARIGEAEISGHIRFLSDDLTEGRGPGSRGSQVAVRYLAAQLEAAGLEPGVPGREGAPASWFQEVPLVKLAGQVPPEVEVRGERGALSLRTTGGVEADLVVSPSAEAERVALRGAELVFVGYGITAPEHGWDDYRGVDVRGKVVVVLNFNPPFAGEGVRTWYGRWPYKYQNAAEHGASGAIIVHTTPSAGYPWQVLSSSATGTGWELPAEPGEARLQAQIWISEPAARRLFELAGLDLDERTRAAQASRGGFAAQPLGLGLSLDMPVARTEVSSPNVVGILRGADPRLRDQAVVFTAHHDHLGVKAGAPSGTDAIYNGALDNASGCATVLAMARAATAARPKRSLLFVFTTAEEMGLLGARWFGRHPPVPIGKIAADVNLDATNIWGRTADVGLLALGRSSLDAVVRDVAAAQRRTVHGDPFPDRGFYYRGDHLELARLGVPDVSLRGGPHYRGRPEGWGQERQREFETRHYHQPSDEYPPAPGRWDLSGTVEDAQLQLVVGLRIANAPELPRWRKGDEFEAARLAATR
jgi:Zn-dependent M28 family amino/carboxypeptidase